jgi:hypothetical protein
MRRKTSAPVTEPTTSRRSPPLPHTTTHRRSLTREVEEQAPSERRREWRVGTVYKGRRNRRHFASCAAARAGAGSGDAREEVSPSRQSPREPPRRRPKSPACAATSSAPKKRGFWSFPEGQTERAFLALGSQSRSRATTTSMASCSPRAQPGLRAGVANVPSVSANRNFSQQTKALFSSQKNLQNFSDSPSHRIF